MATSGAARNSSSIAGSLAGSSTICGSASSSARDAGAGAPPACSTGIVPTQARSLSFGISVRNSSSVNSAARRSVSGTLTRSCSRSSSIGTSRRSVTSWRYSRALSACCSSASRGRLPGISVAREDRIEIAVCCEQLQRGLVPDASHARDVVGAVAHQREKIHDALGLHTEALARVGLIDPLLFHRRLTAAPRVEQRDARTDELIEILVARHDHRLQTAGGHGALRERGDYVVRLVAV